MVLKRWLSYPPSFLPHTALHVRKIWRGVQERSSCIIKIVSDGVPPWSAAVLRPLVDNYWVFHFVYRKLLRLCFYILKFLNFLLIFLFIVYETLTSKLAFASVVLRCRCQNPYLIGCKHLGYNLVLQDVLNFCHFFSRDRGWQQRPSWLNYHIRTQLLLILVRNVSLKYVVLVDQKVEARQIDKV